jgi:hypothetical protein
MSHVTGLILIVTPTEFCWGRTCWETDERDATIMQAVTPTLLAHGLKRAEASLARSEPHLHLTMNWGKGWLIVDSTLPDTPASTTLREAVKRAGKAVELN